MTDEMIYDDDDDSGEGRDLQDMKQNWSYADAYWHDTFKKAKDDINLLHGDGGWDPALRERRESNSLMCMEFNQLKQHAALIRNSFRSEEVGIDVMKTDSDGDEDISDIFEGIARGIEQDSHAISLYRKAHSLQTVAGLAWLALESDYEHDGFDQVLKIKSLDDYNSAVIDPGDNPQYGFIPRVINKKEFEKRYPGIEPGWPKGMESLEGAGKCVVMEYYYLKPVKKMIYMLDDGSIYSETGDINEALMGRTVIKEREIESHQCFMRLCTLNSWLGEPQETVFDQIPLYPVLGRRVSIEGSVHYEGAFSDSKDPQREYNYHRTMASEVSAMAPRYAFIAEDKAVDGYEDDFTSYMHKPVALLRYRSGFQKPMLEQPKMPDMAASQQVEMSRQDIMASVGRYEATIGEQGNEKSGTAIKARQQSGDLGSQDFKDNFAEALTKMLRGLVRAIPKTYDTERMLRIVSKNGSDLSKVVNHKEVDDQGNERIVNNLALGRYDLKVSIGPGYRAQREEAVEKMAVMIGDDLELKRRTIDLWAKYVDSPMSDSLHERVEGLVPDDALNADELRERFKASAEREKIIQEVGAQNPQITEMQETIQQMDQVIQELSQSQAESESRITKSKADGMIAELKVQREELALQVAQANAEKQRSIAQADQLKLKAEVDKTQRDDEKLIDDAQTAAVRRIVEQNAQADKMTAEFNNQTGDNNG